MAKRSVRHNLMILLLSVAGGGVDAILISSFQVLAGAQTGNTVLLAVALGQGRFSVGFYSAVSVAAFIAGSIAGEVAILERKSESALAPIRRALGVELISLGVLFVCWHFAPSPGWQMTAFLVALAAVAMGIQSAAVLSIHGSPATTYITGALSKFSTDLTRWLFVRRLGTRSKPESPLLSSDGRVLFGLAWLVYLGGGVVSALLYLSVKDFALLFPILAIATAMTCSCSATTRASGTD